MTDQEDGPGDADAGQLPWGDDWRVPLQRIVEPPAGPLFDQESRPEPSPLVPPEEWGPEYDAYARRMARHIRRAVVGIFAWGVAGGLLSLGLTQLPDMRGPGVFVGAVVAAIGVVPFVRARLAADERRRAAALVAWAEPEWRLVRTLNVVLGRRQVSLTLLDGDAAYAGRAWQRPLDLDPHRSICFMDDDASELLALDEPRSASAHRVEEGGPVRLRAASAPGALWLLLAICLSLPVLPLAMTSPADRCHDDLRALPSVAVATPLAVLQTVRTQQPPDLEDPPEFVDSTGALRPPGVRSRSDFYTANGFTRSGDVEDPARRYEALTDLGFRGGLKEEWYLEDGHVSLIVMEFPTVGKALAYRDIHLDSLCNRAESVRRSDLGVPWAVELDQRPSAAHVSELVFVAGSTEIALTAVGIGDDERSYVRAWAVQLAKRLCRPVTGGPGEPSDFAIDDCPVE